MNDTPKGHQYHVIDGRGGPWLAETTDEYPEPTGISRIADLLAAADRTEWGADGILRAALVNALDNYSGPADDTVRVLRSWLQRTETPKVEPCPI